MKTEHTPGPWFADANGCIWRRDPRELYENGGSVAGDRPLASAHVGWAGEGLTGYRMEANARLIAAAPELLAALRSCASVCAGFTTHKQGLIDALEKANAAIKKATGEQL